jgi:AcrR family transcriptional regulator
VDHQAEGASAPPDPIEVAAWQRQILLLEERGVVTRTFRRLDPERQRAVIEAIFAEAAQHGPYAMQVRQVARRAGVSVGSLYQYFPNREGMLDFAVDATAGFLVESLDAWVPAMSDLPLRQGLEAYLDAGTEWTAANAGLLGFFASTAYSGSAEHADRLVNPVARSMRALLHALLKGAQSRGELRRGLDVDTATRLVMTLTTAVADAELIPHLNRYYLLHDADHPPAGMRGAAVDFLLHAIGRHGADEPSVGDTSGERL